MSGAAGCSEPQLWRALTPLRLVLPVWSTMTLPRPIAAGPQPFARRPSAGAPANVGALLDSPPAGPPEPEPMVAAYVVDNVGGDWPLWAIPHRSLRCANMPLFQNGRAGPGALPLPNLLLADNPRTMLGNLAAACVRLAAPPGVAASTDGWIVRLGGFTPATTLPAGTRVRQDVLATQILGGLVSANARWPVTTAAWRSIAHEGHYTCPVSVEDAELPCLPNIGRRLCSGTP